ncbi:MAG: hypothetical protein JWO94_3302 [Verrucomicrobiaceae bacterium]|nr:hypothetical protein [Verrucomicrobiaceae bacterium]
MPSSCRTGKALSTPCAACYFLNNGWIGGLLSHRVTTLFLAMSAPETTPRKIVRQIGNHGVLALVMAVVSLFAVRGFDWNKLLLFGIPTLFALVSARRNSSRVAEAFLISVGVAAIIAAVPRLFPQLGSHGALSPDAYNNRLMTLYLCIYLLWLFVVLPLHLFGGSLRARRRGEPARFSWVTCWLGLFAANLFWLIGLASLPSILASIGLWPVM